MIKVSVVINNNKWLTFIKNPIIYLKKKLNKISKYDKQFQNKNIYFTILLSNNKEIKQLNNKFRKKNKTTDVLSFPFQDKKEFKNILKNEKKIYLGDIVINLDKIKNKDLKIFKSEFDRLWIHGFVHLFGFDHKKDFDFLKMSKVEKKYIDLIND